MPTVALQKIPHGSDVFLDANVLIYGLSGSSAECIALLNRCASEEITGITSFAVVGEVTHRLMLEEAKSKGLASAQPRKTLEEHPERIKLLTDYWVEIERLLSLNLLMLTVDEQMVRAAHIERQRHGLLNNDSLIVACMRQYGLSMIATHDHTFERVTSISVFSPADV